MANIIIPGNDAVSKATDPYVLADRIPGMRESLDGVKELREAYRDEARLQYGVAPDAQHLGSVHPSVMWMWMLAYGDELLADDAKLLKQLLKRHQPYAVAR